MSSRVAWSRGQVRQHQEQSRVRWTNGLTKIFADLIVDQVRKGNRINNSFSGKAWKSIGDGFYQKTGLQWDTEKLKNRYAVMRRQYAIVKSLLQRKEFHFDASTGAVVASSEAWADYIEGNPDAEAIHNGGCPIYKQLCTIFSMPATNGTHDEMAEEEVEISPSVPTGVEIAPPSSDAEISPSGANEAEIPIFVPRNEPLEMIKEEPALLESEEADDVADQTFLPLMNTAITNRKRGRRGVDDAIAEAILQMAAAAKLKTAVINRINARYSIADCIKELDKMQGVGGDVYFTALDLFNKPNAREIFLSLKGEKRLIWLHNKCTPHLIT